MPYARKTESLRYRKSAPAQRKASKKTAHRRKTQRLAWKTQKTGRILQRRRISADAEARRPRSTRTECAHRHGLTAYEVPESASYGDAVVAAAAAAVVSGAAVVASPTPDSMLY